MFQSRIAAALARRNIHYGWVVVAVTFLSALITAGTLSTPGVMIVPLQKEFGWTTEQISTALAIRLALFGLMGPFAAAFMNRFGLRQVVAVALLLIGGGMLASLSMTQVWHLVVLWGVVVGVGTGLTAMVLGATIATRWFTASRGLVVGLLTASTATGQLAILPLMAALTDKLGWRAALTLVCALLAVGFVAVMAFMRDRPSDVGLPPYGEKDVLPAPPRPTGLKPLVAMPIGVLREAARTRVFWVLAATFFICGLSTNGLIQTHFIPLCGDFGLPAVTAASVLAMMGAFDLVGTIGSGWLSDRMDNRLLLFWYYGLRGLSLIYLPFTDFSLASLSVFAVFYGLDWIATVPPTVKLAAIHFGREKAPLVFGWVFAAHQLGAATAAFGAGYARTAFASYLPAFFVAGVACVIAALLVLTLSNRATAEAPKAPAAAPA